MLNMSGCRLHETAWFDDGDLGVQRLVAARHLVPVDDIAKSAQEYPFTVETPKPARDAVRDAIAKARAAADAAGVTVEEDPQADPTPASTGDAPEVSSRELEDQKVEPEPEPEQPVKSRDKQEPVPEVEQELFRRKGPSKSNRRD